MFQRLSLGISEDQDHTPFELLASGSYEIEK